MLTNKGFPSGKPLFFSGCSGRDRTCDQVINSHLLYRWATEQSSLNFEALISHLSARLSIYFSVFLTELFFAAYIRE